MSTKEMSMFTKTQTLKALEEIEKLNRFLDEAMPNLPKLEIYDDTLVNDITRLVAEFNVKIRLYIAEKRLGQCRIKDL